MEKEFFVQVSSFKLFAKLYGEKMEKPMIVMDAGYGENSKTWDPIVSEISRFTEVLVYDRAGLGKSEKSPNPRTSIEMVKELNELLTELKLKPPYILVGHSFGGVNARIHAATYPNEVAGLVLVDSPPKDYRERFLPTMSKEFQEAYNNQFIHEGTYDEFMESMQQLKEISRRTTLNIPLIVLSAGNKVHYSRKSQELWNEMQKEILDLSNRSELIIVENSAHYIQNDAPSIVINAIRRIIEDL